MFCSHFLGRALQHKKHLAFHFFPFPVMKVKPKNACALWYSVFEIFPIKVELRETRMEAHNHNVNVYFLHFLFFCVCVFAQSRPTLWNPMDCNPIRLLSPWGCKGVGHNLATKQQLALNSMEVIFSSGKKQNMLPAF